MGKASKATVGSLIDQMFDVREQIRELNEKVKALSATKDEMEIQLIAALEAQGVEQSRGARASATLTKPIVPRVVDWDKAYAFVIKHKLPYLFEKRISSTVYREILSGRNNVLIPGIESFEKKTISLHTN